MTNKAYAEQFRIKKVITGIIAILFLFYLASCGETVNSPPSGEVKLGPIKALTLKEVTENSITVNWELLRTGEGVVDPTITYIVYAETNDGDGGKVFTKDPSTETEYNLFPSPGTRLPLDDTGNRADGVEVTDLNNNTPYRIVVETRDALGNTSQSRLLAYTASELTNTDITSVVVTTTLDQEEVTVTWDANAEAQGYAIKGTVSENQFGGDTTTEDIIAVVCLPESLLCEGDGLATEEGGKLKYNLKVYQKGVRYDLVIVPFNFRDLAGLQAVDEQGLEKTFIEEVLAQVEDETSLLATRLENTLKDPGKVQDVKVEVSVIGPPTDLSLTITGSTVLATWRHGEGADFYYAFITSNAGVNAVTNIINRYEPGGRFAGGGYTSFTGLTANTRYTVTVQSFTVITNVTNVGGGVSATLSTKDAEETLEAPGKVTAGDLSLTNHEAGKLGITWNTPEPNSVIGYNVFYWVGDTAPNKPQYVAAKGETNLVFTLEPNTYKVRVDVLSTYPGQEVVTGDDSPIMIYGKPLKVRGLGVVFSRGSFTEIENKLYATRYPLTYFEADTSAQAGGPVEDVSYHYRYRVAGGDWGSYVNIEGQAVIDLLVDDLGNADVVKSGYGKKYQVELVASNEGGFVSDTGTLEFTYKSFPEPFVQSENLKVIEGDRSLTVTWPDVAEKNGSTVAGYTVALSDNPYALPLQVTNVVARKVVFEGLINNHSYLITVIPNDRITGNILTALSLVTGYTIGAPVTPGSDEERILGAYTGLPDFYTPQGTPEAVVSLAVTPGENLATVTWDASTVGSPASKYVLEYLADVTTPLITNVYISGDAADAELSGLSWAGAVSVEVETNATGSYSEVVDGLNVSSATNVFRVRPVRIDDSGKEWQGEYRYYALGTDISRAPSSLGDLVFSDHDLSGSFTVTWSKPTNAGQKKDGSPAQLDGYRVSWGTTISVDEGSAVITEPNTLSYTITSLTPGTQYYVKVEAKNDNTEGNIYNVGIIRSTYTLKTPGAVVVTTIAYSGHTTNGFKVDWGRITDTGYNSEGALTSVGYLLELSSDQGQNWQSIARSDYLAITETLSGLTSGTRYRVRVTTTNGFNSASPSEGGDTWTISLPGKVGSITYSGHTINGFKVDWGRVTDAGYGPQGALTSVGYLLEWSSDQGQNWQSIARSDYLAITETLSGLTSGTQYRVRVTTTNGFSSASPSEGGDTWALSLPGQVRDLVVSDPSYDGTTTPDTSGFKVSWVVPENTGLSATGGAAAVTGYEVAYAEVVNDIVGEYTSATHTGTATEYVFTGLKTDAQYRIRVQAKTLAGVSAENHVSGWTPSLPGAVASSSILLILPTADTIGIEWAASQAGRAGGSSSTNATNSYKVEIAPDGGSYTLVQDNYYGTAITATGLSTSTTYRARITAKNANGEADASISSGTGTTTESNDILRQAQPCAKTTSVDLAWDASSGATYYKLYRNNAEITSITTTSYTETDLTPATTYTYKVQACKGDLCSGDSDSLTITTLSDKVFKSIIDSGRTPADLTGYDEMSREIFSHYSIDVPIVAKYLKPGGTGDGSSFADAEGNLKTVLEGIKDAAADNIYLVFLTGGNYKPGSSMAMKNHVAIVGGVSECLGSSDTATALDGEGSYRLFNQSGLNSTALLYGVTVTNGVGDFGGGMANFASSPSLVRVVFSGNTANNNGGGLFNGNGASPSLKKVTFSGNRSLTHGGAVYNKESSPSFVEVTFSGNSTTKLGGGVYNWLSSSIFVGVTFSGNTAERGAGLFNYFSSPSLVGVTFSENTADFEGGAIFNNNNGEVGPLVVNGIFWGNTGVASTNADVEFYFRNTTNVDGSDPVNSQENLQIYNSIVFSGTGELVSGASYYALSDATNEGGFFSDKVNGAPVVISFSNIFNNDPGLGPLANNGGAVWTYAIAGTSPAVNQGLYVKKKDSTFYYSKDSTTWYTEPGLSGTAATVPTDAEDLTATDATGYIRTGRPDLGAYEAR